jgi:hypothetical protein
MVYLLDRLPSNWMESWNVKITIEEKVLEFQNLMNFMDTAFRNQLHKMILICYWESYFKRMNMLFYAVRKRNFNEKNLELKEYFKFSGTLGNGMIKGNRYHKYLIDLSTRWQGLKRRHSCEWKWNSLMFKYANPIKKKNWPINFIMDDYAMQLKSLDIKKKLWKHQKNFEVHRWSNLGSQNILLKNLCLLYPYRSKGDRLLLEE